MRGVGEIDAELDRSTPRAIHDDDAADRRRQRVIGQQVHGGAGNIFRRRNGIVGQPRDPENERRDEEPSTGSQPIYVWDPGAPTESFPPVPPGKNQKA